MFKHILVTTDGSELANLALPVARDLGQRLGSRLTLLYVVPDPITYMPPTGAFTPGDLYDELQNDLYIEGENFIDKALGQLDFPDAEGRLVRAQTRDVARVIAEEAEALGSSMIIMSTHGRSGLGHLLLGSVADRVVRTAKTPVLLVRLPMSASKTGQGQPEHKVMG